MPILTKSLSDISFPFPFTDVGQGDSALIECDGQIMLIDAGEKQYGEKVGQILKDHVGSRRKLDFLVISHPHSDHIGGLVEALNSVSSIGATLSNTDYYDSEVFRQVEHQLGTLGSRIKVPDVGDQYKLGSATIDVIDVASNDPNDSLVIMITYGKNKFLFTGDIEYAAQKRIVEKYRNDEDKEYKIDLMKMPHHGSSGESNEHDSDLYSFVRTFMPDYAIISCGAGNIYGHPHQRTLDILNNKAYSAKIYRTDLNGDITVKSNGKEISVQTTK